MKKIITILCTLLMLFYPGKAKAFHVSIRILEIPSEILQAVEKILTVESLASEGIYVIQNLDKLGYAGIIRLANVGAGFNDVSGGALESFADSSGLGDLMSDSQGGILGLDSAITDIFPEFEMDDFIDGLMTGDAFGTLTSVTGDSFGMDNVFENELLDQFASYVGGDLLPGIVESAVTGGDVDAAFDKAKGEFVDDAIDEAYDRGTDLAEDGLDAMADQTNIGGVADSYSDSINATLGTNINAESILPSSNQIVSGALKGDMSGVANSMQNNALNQAEKAGTDIGENAIDDASEGLKDSLNSATSDSGFFDGVDTALSGGSEIKDGFDDVGNLYMDVSGSFKDVVNDVDGVAGDLGLDDEFLNSVPGLPNSLMGEFRDELDLPYSLYANDILNDELAGMFPDEIAEFLEYAIDSNLSQVGGSIHDLYGLEDLMDSSSKKYSNTLAPEELSGPITSGDADVIINARSDYNQNVANADVFTQNKAVRMNITASYIDSYAMLEVLANQIATKTSRLDKEGLTYFDKINKSVQEQTTVNGTMAAMIQTQIEEQDAVQFKILTDAAIAQYKYGGNYATIVNSYPKTTVEN